MATPLSRLPEPGDGSPQAAVTISAVTEYLLPATMRGVAALALSVLFSAALTTPARSGAPASGHRPPSLSAPGQAAKPTTSKTLPDGIASRHVGGP